MCSRGGRAARDGREAAFAPLAMFATSSGALGTPRNDGRADGENEMKRDPG